MFACIKFNHQHSLGLFPSPDVFYFTEVPVRDKFATLLVARRFVQFHDVKVAQR